MSDPLVRVALSGASDFQPLALAPGLPMLDARKLTWQVLLGWFGDLLAEPEPDEEGVAFHVQTGGVRQVVTRRTLATQKDLDGSLGEDYARLRKALFDIRPVSPSERLIFNRLQPPIGQFDGFLFRVRTEQDERDRLIWCWGYQRRSVEGASADRPGTIDRPDANQPGTNRTGTVRLCPAPQCSFLFVPGDATLDVCPRCGRSLTVSEPERRRTRFPAGAALAATVLLGSVAATYWIAARDGNAEPDPFAGLFASREPAGTPADQRTAEPETSADPRPADGTAEGLARLDEASATPERPREADSGPVAAAPPRVLELPAPPTRAAHQPGSVGESLEPAAPITPGQPVDSGEPIAAAGPPESLPSGEPRPLPIIEDSGLATNLTPLPPAPLPLTPAPAAPARSAESALPERSPAATPLLPLAPSVASPPSERSPSERSPSERSPADRTPVSESSRRGPSAPATLQPQLEPLPGSTAAEASTSTDSSAASSAALAVTTAPQTRLGTVSWHEDYLTSYQAAVQQRRPLLIVIRDPAEGDRIESPAHGLAAPELADDLERFVRAVLAVNAVTPRSSGDVPGLLLEHRAFRHLGVRPGLLIVDLTDPESPTFGQVVSALPQPDDGRYDVPTVATLLNLPAGPISQRTLLLALRTSGVESPVAGGSPDPALCDLARRQARLMAHFDRVELFEAEERRAALEEQFGQGVQVRELIFAAESAGSIQEAAIEAARTWLDRPDDRAALTTPADAWGLDLFQSPATGRWYAAALLVTRAGEGSSP